MAKKIWRCWKGLGLVCVFWWLGMAWMMVSGDLMPRNGLWLGSVFVTLVIFGGWLWQVRQSKDRKGLATALLLVVTLGTLGLAVGGFEKESVVEENGDKLLLREDGHGGMRYYVYKNAFVAGEEKSLPVDSVAPALRKEAPMQPLDVCLETTAEGLRVFNVDLDALIQSYNGYYWSQHGVRYLLDAKDWQLERQPAGMHFQEETDVYTYCADFSKWTLPRMSAYCTTSDGRLREAVCNYDDHSYSPESFKLYEEDCATMLRVFVPSLSAETAKEWATKINKVGDDNTFNSDKQYRRAEMKPTDLFVHGNVGVFSYVAIGAPLNFCVIPVDEALVNAYQADGVRIHALA